MHFLSMQVLFLLACLSRLVVGKIPPPSKTEVFVNETSAAIDRFLHRLGGVNATSLPIDSRRPNANFSASVNPTLATPSAIVLHNHTKNGTGVVRDSVLDRYRNKGRQIHANMMRASNERHQDRGPQDLDQDAWHVQSKVGDVPLDFASVAAGEYIGFPNEAYETFSLIELVWTHNENIFYLNTFNPGIGAIIAENNNAVDNGQRSPWHWSDVVWPTWSALAEDIYQVDIKGLEFIIRNSVKNEDSLDVINAILPVREHHVFHEFVPNDDDFYALLGCPNGIGGAYICTNYATSLEFKVVKSIVVFWDSYAMNWNMIQWLDYND